MIQTTYVKNGGIPLTFISFNYFFSFRLLISPLLHLLLYMYSTVLKLQPTN